MKTPDNFSLLIAPGALHVRGSATLKYVIGGLFIVLVAAFLTSPVSDRPSAYDAPLPMPDGLGIDY